MSLENAKKFIRKLADDKNLSEKLDKHIMDAYTAFAAKAGFDCTADDISKCCSELSDDELKDITAAGGLWGARTWMEQPKRQFFLGNETDTSPARDKPKNLKNF